MDRTTIDLYDEHGDEWIAARSPRDLAQARELRSSVVGTILDVGCGPGWHLDALSTSEHAAIGIDASATMNARASQRGCAVRANFDDLPFNRASIAGAWAWDSYVHCPRRSLPLALGELHRVIEPGGIAAIQVFNGDQEFGTRPGDSLGGRRFAVWGERDLRLVLAGAGFSVTSWRTDRDSHEVFVRREVSLADTVGPGMSVLIVGLNPSIYSAERGVGFARPGNRFWPAALDAGLVSEDRAATHALREHGVGLTDVVKRATARADELAPDEFVDGLARIEFLCTWLAPRLVVFVGLGGYRIAVDRRARAGLQERQIGPSMVYVMPNTSGLNAHTTHEGFVAHFREVVALAAED